MMKLYKLFFCITLLAITGFSSAYAEMPVTTDSRIKIFVYNENEVFHLMIHYGYQSNIEFGQGEDIETISMGESYSWKITPIGRRLFIKPLQVNVRTNMTVITNKHTYQFDIISKMPDDKLDNDLVYVARFFYPEKNLDKVEPTFSGNAAPIPVQPYSQKMMPQAGMSSTGTDGATDFNNYMNK